MISQPIYVPYGECVCVCVCVSVQQLSSFFFFQLSFTFDVGIEIMSSRSVADLFPHSSQLICVFLLSFSSHLYCSFFSILFSDMFTSGMFYMKKKFALSAFEFSRPLFTSRLRLSIPALFPLLRDSFPFYRICLSLTDACNLRRL